MKRTNGPRPTVCFHVLLSRWRRGGQRWPASPRFHRERNPISRASRGELAASADGRSLGRSNWIQWPRKDMADTAKLQTLFLLFTLVRKRSRRNESNFCRRHFHSPGIELRKIPWNKSRSWKEFFLRSFRSSDLCPIGRRFLSLSLSFE